MWYNKVVTDSDNNILFKERIFIINGSGGYSFGVDVFGNFVMVWWDE